MFDRVGVLPQEIRSTNVGWSLSWEVALSALRSAIEAFTATDPSDLSPQELTSDVAEAARAIDLLNHRLAVLANQARTAGSFQSEGFLTATRWLADSADYDNARARRIVNLGTILAAHPDTDRRASAGDLSGSRTRILTRAAANHPDQYRQHENMLLDFADTMSLKDFRRAVGYWSNCADQTRAEYDYSQQQDASYLHVSRTYGEMVKIDGLVDKEAGETLLTALNAAMTPDARQHGSHGALDPAPQRRARALGLIATQFLNNHPGKIGGQRPHVTVVVDLDTLVGRTGTVCELEHTGTITPETARRILCDAEATWLITKGNVPLAMGRSKRTATPQQLRALAVRDSGCVHPGCTRPPAWCDAHHIIPWHQGGRTDLGNLELRCRRHHILAHRPEWAP